MSEHTDAAARQSARSDSRRRRVILDDVAEIAVRRALTGVQACA